MSLELQIALMTNTVDVRISLADGGFEATVEQPAFTPEEEFVSCMEGAEEE